MSSACCATSERSGRRPHSRGGSISPCRAPPVPLLPPTPARLPTGWLMCRSSGCHGARRAPPARLRLWPSGNGPPARTPSSSASTRHGAPR
eukprot:6266263-Prymnesium_polylepis.1